MGFKKYHASTPQPSPTPAPPPNYTAATAGPSTAFQTRFASVSLHMEDRLRFLNFPEHVLGMCRYAVQSSWKRGIQSEGDYGGSWEFKLQGHPWRGSGDDAVQARRLVTAILRTLHSQGWVLMLSTDISKKNRDKDTLMFRHQVPAPADCDWCCIGFSKRDRIKFIDVPPEVYEAFISRLPRGRVQDHYRHSPGVYEAKLSGRAWWAQGTETMAVRQLLLTLLEVLETEGWTVYASVDQKNGSENVTETDTASFPFP